jgi:hypothetical protein
VAESVSNNAAKSRSNGRTKVTAIYIKNGIRVVIVVPFGETDSLYFKGREVSKK